MCTVQGSREGGLHLPLWLLPTVQLWEKDLNPGPHISDTHVKGHRCQLHIT